MAKLISNYHRGFKAVAVALGLRPGSNPPFVKPGASWLEWVNVLVEMPAVGKLCGVPAQMPTNDQLRANGYTSLVSTITKHYGGMYKVAERLNHPQRDRGQSGSAMFWTHGLN